MFDIASRFVLVRYVHFFIASMGSGSSRLRSPRVKFRWWAPGAHKKVKATAICSAGLGLDEAVIRSMDEAIIDRCLEKISDLETNDLWRESPWDRSWQLPLEGAPSEIAGELHSVATCAVFRVPLSHLVKYNLGYITKESSVMSLLQAVCDISDHLYGIYQDRPELEDLYLEVEKVSNYKDHLERSY